MRITTTRRIQLIDGFDPTRASVESHVFRDMTSGMPLEAEEEWRQERSSMIEGESLAGWPSYEHVHWDWRRKISRVEAGLRRLIAITSRPWAACEGLMAVLDAPKRSAISGDPLVYVDYVEAAPWNLKLPTRPPRFLGVGTALISEAILIGLDAGCEGRIGLHSLPQAEPFHRSRCGMAELGQDTQYFDLNYFEFTSLDTSSWLQKIGVSQ